MARAFRRPESLQAEQATRDAIKPFLESLGYDVDDVRRVTGTAQRQIVTASRSGVSMFRARVKLCWRREDTRSAGAKYAASQLALKAKNGDPFGTIAELSAKDSSELTSHLLLVQWDGIGIELAALVPVEAVADLWRTQHSVYDDLIRQGETGRIAKNPASNGDSPTLYLQDDRTPQMSQAAAVLWTWAGVVNLMSQSGIIDARPPNDDTFDDLGADKLLGRDEGERSSTLRSGFKRDAKVRKAVLERSGGTCERRSCRESRSYPGFLDVHHILGVFSSDRVWSCVALCPNCHREAHFSPEREKINEDLRLYAESFD